MDVDFFQQPGTLGQVPTGSSTAAAGTFGLPQLPTLDANGDPEPERPKTKKELEQDSKDLELAHLLEMMDEYKPIVRERPQELSPLSPSSHLTEPLIRLCTHTQIPDEVTDYYLQKSGFETDDVRVYVELGQLIWLSQLAHSLINSKRMLALAAQRFVSSISTDAFQYARARTNAGPGSRAKDSSAARQKVSRVGFCYGVSVRHS